MGQQIVVDKIISKYNKMDEVKDIIAEEGAAEQSVPQEEVVATPVVEEVPAEFATQ